MMTKRVAFLFLAASFVAVGQLQAAMITSWNLQGKLGNEVSDPATDNPGIDAYVDGTLLTRGPGLLATAASNAFSSSGWDTAQAGTPAADTDYYDFGFTLPGLNAKVDADDLYIGMRSSATGPGTMGVYTSVDGGAYSLLTSLVLPPAGAFLNTIVDLSSLPTAMDSLKIRLIEIGNTNAGATGTTGVNGTYRVTGYFVGGVFDRNMQITGTFIPEPASIALMGLAAIGLLGFARRK